MTIGDAGSSAQAQARRLRFDRYVLDLDRGCLLRDGNEIALRPKIFAVLRHLSENACRLVSKDELFAAVWPNMAITDDALVQSVGELRRALGDDGARLIKTIPRRGYRFESNVSVMAPIDASVTGGALDPPASRDDAQQSEPSVTHASTFPTTALIGWRAGMFAALAVVILLAAGALLLLAGLASEWKFLGAPR